MDSLTHIELVDRDNNVIATEAIPLSAFPVTMRLANSPETLAVSSPAPTGWRRWAHTPVGTLAAIVAAFVVFEFYVYLHQPAEPGTLTFAASMFLVGGLLIWPGFWTLIGRNTQRKGQMRAHQLWACAMIALAVVATDFSSWLDFLWPHTVPITIATTLLLLAVGIVAISGHLAIASKIPSTRRWYVAGFIVIVVSASGALITTMERRAFDTNLIYDPTLKPLDARFIPTTNHEAFVQELDAIEKDLLKQSQKK